jgi:Zn-dependent metalloprotease
MHMLFTLILSVSYIGLFNGGMDNRFERRIHSKDHLLSGLIQVPERRKTMSFPLRMKIYWRAALLFLLIWAVYFGGSSQALIAEAPETHPLKSAVTLKSFADLNNKEKRADMARPLKQKTSGGKSHLMSLDTVKNLHKTLGVSHSRQGTGRKSLTIDDAQYQNFQTLLEKNAAGIQARFNGKNGTPIFIKTGKNQSRKSPRSIKSDLSASRDIAQKFLRDNRELLKISDPDTEMRIQKEWTDSAGARHFRYQQFHQGILLWGKQAAVHLDTQDSVYLFHGRYEPSPESVTTSPAITQAEALETVKTHLGITGSLSEPPETELVIYTADDGKMSLAYKTEISPAIDQRWLYFISAADGSFLHRIQMIRNSLVSAGGRDLSGINRNFSAWAENGTYYLVDPSLPLDDPPYANVSRLQSFGNTYILDAMNSDGSDLDFVKSRAADSGWDPAGVSAMYHVRQIYDYYRNTFGRQGIDDDHMNYVVVLHPAGPYDTYWNGSMVCLGDGDDWDYSSFAASLDVIAHEIQHGITGFTAGLVYENQSGALDEAYADIFACMIDRDDWTMGEDNTLTSPGYLRSLANPAMGKESLPTKMSEYVNLRNTEATDNGGVHTNMSIPARAAYLIAEGLSKEGLGTAIGRNKTEQIFYRALTTYLQPYSQFLDARDATLQAAEDLYGSGSSEAGAVQAAWDAVEVYEGSAGSPDTQKPTATDAISGQDMMIYLYPVSADAYDLYVQTIPSPFSGYDPNLDSRDLNYEYARKTKPSAITLSDGTLLFYVGIDNNLYAVTLGGESYTQGYRQQITHSGDIWSFAVSPDGRYFAYTSASEDDNNIYVGDLDSGTVAEYPAVPDSDLPPEYGGTVINTILYVDSLSFDYSGRRIVFDARNCLSTPDDPCTGADGGYRYWSVGILDLWNGSFEYPFPNQDPDFDIAYPSFAYNNSYVVVLDVIDRSRTGSVSSGVWTLNWQNQTSQFVVNPNFSDYDAEVYGVPSFWGDDDYVTVQSLLPTADIRAFRVPVDASWKGDPMAAEQLNDYEVLMPVMHRMGERNLSARVEPSASSLNFGSVSMGKYSTRDLTLSNSGNRDIDITDISIAGASDFSHNGTNARLPRNTSMKIRLKFSPSARTGTRSATLTITSDADIPQTHISLTGTGGEEDAVDTSTDSSNEDCFIGTAAR